MRRRILTSIIAVTALAVVLFGVPLAIVVQDQPTSTTPRFASSGRRRPPPARCPPTSPPPRTRSRSTRRGASARLGLYLPNGQKLIGSGPTDGDAPVEAAARTRSRTSKPRVGWSSPCPCWRTSRSSPSCAPRSRSRSSTTRFARPGRDGRAGHRRHRRRRPGRPPGRPAALPSRRRRAAGCAPARRRRLHDHEDDLGDQRTGRGERRPGGDGPAARLAADPGACLQRRRLASAAHPVDRVAPHPGERARFAAGGPQPRARRGAPRGRPAGDHDRRAPDAGS